MEAKYKSATDVLADAQDLVVLGRSGDNHVYAVKPSLAFQRQAYEESIVDANERDTPAFQNHWKLGKNGIEGSSTFLALRLDKRVARPRGLWIPGLLEAKALESQGKLENGVYRDYGNLVYSNGEPNKQIAERLTTQAQELGLPLPLVVPFRALDYSPDKKDKEYGVVVSLVENPQGIISGNEAVKEINKLNWKGNSGFHRLVRYRDGDWDADWSYLDDSDDFGRVEWFCGEATSQNLKDAHDMFLEREFGAELRKRKEQFDRLLNQ